jgi:hypothetical protein
MRKPMTQNKLFEIFVYRPENEITECVNINSPWIFIISKIKMDEVIDKARGPRMFTLGNRLDTLDVALVKDKSFIIPLEVNENFIKIYLTDDNKIYWIWSRHILYRKFGLFFKRLK